MSAPISSVASYGFPVTVSTSKPTSAPNEKLETPGMEASESLSEKARELNTEGSIGTRINTTA